MRFVYAPAVLCAFAVAGFLLFAPAAGADLVFCSSAGEGPGQCTEPTGLDVDRSSGEVYVADRANNRVDVFGADGSFKRAFGWDVIPPGGAGDTGTGLETCTEASGCKAGSRGSELGQFRLGSSGPDSVAVDNDPASPAYHDVYVFDGENSRVQRFHPGGEFVLAFGSSGSAEGQFDASDNPLAVGQGGVIYVAGKGAGGQSRVQSFQPTGALIEQKLLVRDECEEGKAAKQVPLKEELIGLAVDGTGDTYVAALGGGGVRKYDPSGALLSPCAPIDHGSANIRAIALDPAGHLFVGDNTETTTAIYEYDASGATVHVHYGNGTLKNRPISLAPYSDSSGDLFAIEGSNPRRLAHIKLEPPGPAVLPFETKANPIGNVTATLRAKANAEGKASTVYFQYVDDQSFQSEGGFAGPHTVTTASASIGSDFKAHEASFAIACPNPNVELAEGKCLKPSTVYRFRAVAGDGTNTNDGPEATFETGPPIELGAAWSTGVGADTARLHAELNPNGLSTEARFEYVTDAAYREGIEAAEGEGKTEEEALEEGRGFDLATQTGEFDFGAGSKALSRSALITSLAPHTTYHYRYLAHNFFGDFAGPQPSGERTLITAAVNPEPKDCPANRQFRSGASANLPDCRAYEMVSPIDKAGGDIVALKENNGGALGSSRARIDQATPGGDALSYGSQRAFGDALSAPYSSQYIAGRHPLGSPSQGWSTHSVNPPREGPSLLGNGQVSTELLFSGFNEDLCSAWFLQDTALALAPGAPEEVPDLYRRRNCGEEGYETVSAAQPPGFGIEAEKGGGIENRYRPAIQGFSADGSASAFKAAAALTPEALTVAVGTKLSCETLTGSKQTTYKWLANGAFIPGSESKPAEENEYGTYTTKAGDAGKTIQCQALSPRTGVGTIRVSNPAMVVAPFPASAPPTAPPGIAAPTASAPLAVGGAGGQTLSCDPNEGKWSGATSFAYQWYRNGAALAGKTEATYLVTAGNLASQATFQCAVTGENAGGKATEVSANLLTTPAPETANPDPRVGDVYRAYLEREGALRLVSVLPSGNAALNHASVGTALDNVGSRFGDSVFRAVSASGSRVFFSAEVGAPTAVHHRGAGTGPSRLYLRLNAGAAETTAKDGEGHCVPDPALACTIQISKEAAVFRQADPQGTKALYTEAEAGGEGLYEVDVAKAAAGEAGARTPIANKVKGLLGASTDLSHVYLVSEELCSGASKNSEGEEAKAGALNLYLYQAGESCGAGGFAFVARLASGGIAKGDLSFESRPINRSARVSGSGRYAAFMSRAPLSGYDNSDANSGEADSEVYLYDGQEGKLLCASCNPGGGRPEGRPLSPPDAWAAARIPGWETEFQPSRPLSEGGRLFFESFEGLVSRDSNEAQDVYEWERAASEEECLREIGGERFLAQTNGCLSLISSGKGGGDAEFLDASASGSDVFFTTASSLVPQDPGLIDIYDAREGGGFPPPAAEKPPCEGEACQSPPAAPQDPTPASSGFEGQGNIKTKRTRKHSHKHKHHRKHKSHRGRAAR